MEAMLQFPSLFKDQLSIALPDGVLQDLSHFCLVEGVKH
jgi:hypothetical protein